MGEKHVEGGGPRRVAGGGYLVISDLRTTGHTHHLAQATSRLLREHGHAGHRQSREAATRSGHRLPAFRPLDTDDNIKLTTITSPTMRILPTTRWTSQQSTATMRRLAKSQQCSFPTMCHQIRRPRTKATEHRNYDTTERELRRRPYYARR